MAQVSELDSLKTALTKSTDDQKANILLGLFRLSLTNDLPGAERYAQQMLKTATQVNDTFNVVRANNALGFVKKEMGFLKNSIPFFEKALELSRKHKYREQTKFLINNLGTVCQNTGDYAKSLDYHLESLKMREDDHDTVAITVTLNNIGALYETLGDYGNAIVYYEKNLNIKERAKIETDYELSLINLASAYHGLDQNEEALKYLEKAVERCQANQDCSAKTAYLIFYNSGLVYLKKSDWSKAEKEFEKAGQALPDQNVPDYVAAMISLADVKFQQKDYQSCLEKLNSVSTKAEEFQLPKILLRAYELYGDAYERLKNFEQAAVYRKKFIDLNQKTYNPSLAKDFARVQTDFEQQENLRRLKEQELILNLNQQLLQKKVIQTYFLVAILVLVISFVVVMYRWQQKLKLASQREHQQNLQLTQLNATKDKFFSIISHDLKGPMNSLNSFSQLLVSHLDSLTKEEIQQLAVDVDKSLKNVSVLLENLLEWSRSQSGVIDFTPAELNLSKLIAENVDLLRDQAKAKQIKITTKLFSEHVLVHAHSASINTIIRNLISNAIKFTPLQGEITVTLEMSANEFVVSVRDNGVGISDKIKHMLFRIDSKHSTKGTANESGTGLGLILCKEFVERNGGRIWVESEEQKGSLFQFALPCIPNQA